MSLPPWRSGAALQRPGASAQRRSSACPLRSSMMTPACLRLNEKRLQRKQKALRGKPRQSRASPKSLQRPARRDPKNHAEHPLRSLEQGVDGIDDKLPLRLDVIYERTRSGQTAMAGPAGFSWMRAWLRGARSVRTAAKAPPLQYGEQPRTRWTRLTASAAADSAQPAAARPSGRRPGL